MIVDFAHNEAGIHALFDVAEAIAGGAAGRRAPVTAIIGTAGDRPDDTLRGMGRIAAERASRIAIKETLSYLRGRSRAGVIGEIRAGAVGAGWRGRDPGLRIRGRSRFGASSISMRRREEPAPRVIALLCHEDREGVFKLLAERGFQARGLGGRADGLAPEREGLALRRLELARVGEGRRPARLAGGGHRLAVDGDGVVDADHHEVAGIGPPQRGPDGGQLVEDLVDPDGPTAPPPFGRGGPRPPRSPR